MAKKVEVSKPNDLLAALRESAGLLKAGAAADTKPKRGAPMPTTAGVLRPTNRSRVPAIDAIVICLNPPYTSHHIPILIELVDGQTVVDKSNEDRGATRQWQRNKILMPRVRGPTFRDAR